MAQKKRLILGIGLLALIIVIAVFARDQLAGFAGADPGAGPESGAEDASKTSAFDFTMLDAEGAEIRLSDIIANGKPVILNFWASWCPPCRSEMPDFESVYQELGGEIQFMMVNLTDGQRETVDAAKQYILDEGFTFPVFFDANREGASAYGVMSIPTTIFIDSNGKIAGTETGAISETALRNRIDMFF